MESFKKKKKQKYTVVVRGKGEEKCTPELMVKITAGKATRGEVQLDCFSEGRSEV